MATITTGHNAPTGFSSGETVTATKLNNHVNSATVTNIVDADISAGAAIAASKLAGTLDLSSKTVTLPDSNIGTGKIANAAVTAAKLDGAQTGSAPIYGCRAWVNFNGKDGTTDPGSGEYRCTIRAQGNVSKVVRVATGNYVVHFATPMQDSNYCIVSSGNDDVSDTTFRGTNNIGQNSTASQCQILHKGVNSATQVLENSAHIQVAIFR